jgi:hypothetical protein
VFHAELAALTTRLDADGVCRQSNHYTCGPAAAVTALRSAATACPFSPCAGAAGSSASSPPAGNPRRRTG